MFTVFRYSMQILMTQFRWWEEHCINPGCTAPRSSHIVYCCYSTLWHFIWPDQSEISMMTSSRSHGINQPIRGRYMTPLTGLYRDLQTSIFSPSVNMNDSGQKVPNAYLEWIELKKKLWKIVLLLIKTNFDSKKSIYNKFDSKW